MKRSVPLRRKKRLRVRAPRRLSRSVERGNDPAYLAWVRQQRCCAESLEEAGVLGHRCSDIFRIHAHHAGRKPGVGLKAHDHTAIPLCAVHHGEWHDGRSWMNVFGGWDKAKRREWADARIEETRALWLRSGTVGQGKEQESSLTEGTNHGHRAD